MWRIVSDWECKHHVSGCRCLTMYRYFVGVVVWGSGVCVICWCKVLLGRVVPWASEPWWDEGCSQGMLFMEYSPCVVYYRLSCGLYSRICAVGV